MKIRGVFSMSIINRLKSLFKGDNEESDINTDVSNTSDDVKVTSSKTVSVTVSKGDEEVTLTVLHKICATLEVDIGDIMEFLPE